MKLEYIWILFLLTVQLQAQAAANTLENEMADEIPDTDRAYREPAVLGPPTSVENPEPGFQEKDSDTSLAIEG